MSHSNYLQKGLRTIITVDEANTLLSQAFITEKEQSHFSVHQTYRNGTTQKRSLLFIHMSKKKRSKPGKTATLKSLDSTIPFILDDLRLKQVIEELKARLHQLVREKGLSDLNVLAISQELDTYIVEYQRRKVGKPR